MKIKLFSKEWEINDVFRNMFPVRRREITLNHTEYIWRSHAEIKVQSENRVIQQLQTGQFNSACASWFHTGACSIGISVHKRFLLLKQKLCNFLLVFVWIFTHSSALMNPAPRLLEKWTQTLNLIHRKTRSSNSVQVDSVQRLSSVCFEFFLSGFLTPT